MGRHRRDRKRGAKPWTLGALLLVLGGVSLAAGLRCSLLTSFRDCTADRDCAPAERCHPTRRYCEVPIEELCNGVDDDRDGVPDSAEDFGPCAVPAAPGMCTDGRLRCGTNNRVACVRRTIPAPAEVCDNGIDDDCNRVVDDSAACVQNYPATRGLTLGSNDPAFGEGDDAPEHQVCLAEFSIDRREVTFQALATWLSTLDPTRLSVGPTPTPLNPTQVYGRYLLYDDGGTVVPLVLLPAPPDDLTIDRRAYGFAPHNPRSANLPVVNVTWYGADRYCRYAGKHLPSEAEFFRAAQGPDGRRPFPWGAENPSCDRANVGIGGPDGGPCVGAPVAVGSLARGANPEGVFELYGNINEWMWDYLDDNLTHTENRYYRSLPPTLDAWCTAHPRGPLGPDGGSPIALPNTDGGLYCVQCRMAHGRHYRTVDLRIGIRRWLDADRTDGTVGFRCASGGADR